MDFFDCDLPEPGSASSGGGDFVERMPLKALLDTIIPEAVEDPSGREGKSKEMTKEEANQRGIIWHGQSLEDFLLTQSDMYIAKKNIAEIYKDMVGNAKPGDRNYIPKMQAFRREAVSVALDMFRTSNKLPDPYIQGREWMDSLGDGDSQLPQFYNEAQLYGVSAFNNTTLRTMDRFSQIFGFGVWMSTALLVDTAVSTATSMHDNLTANILLTGGHSGGKSYILKSISETQSPGVPDPTNYLSGKALQMAGADNCRLRAFDELNGEQVGADAAKNNDERSSVLKALMTNPIVMSKIGSHDSDTKERKGYRYVSINHCAWAGCYDGRIPPLTSPMYARWMAIQIDMIDPRSEESIVNRMNQIRDPEMERVRKELLHVQRLRNFNIMLINYLIWCKALPDVTMDGFKMYFDKFNKSMIKKGFTLTGPKAYDQLFMMARSNVLIHTATMAFASDKTKPLREGKNYWDVVPALIEHFSAFLNCTREIALWTFTSCKMLWGNPVAGRITETVHRVKLAPHLEYIDDSVFDSVEMAKNMRARGALQSTQSNPCEDLGDYEGGEAPSRTEEERAQARLELYENDPAIAAELEILQGHVDADEEFKRLLEEKRAAERTESMRASRRTVARLADGVAPTRNERIVSENSMMIGGLLEEDILESGGAAQSRTLSSESSMQGNPHKNTVSALLEAIPVEVTYEGGAVHADPNYIEIRTSDTSIESVVAYIRSNSGTHKPSLDNIRAGLETMAGSTSTEHVLEIATQNDRVVIRKKRDSHGKFITQKFATVKIVKNSKIHDKLGMSNSGSRRVFILTSCLLRQTTLVSAVKESVKEIGFDHSIPGRVMIDAPKYISPLGLAGSKRRESTVRIFDMVLIKPNDKPFILTNIDPITASIRESNARTFDNPNSAVRRFEPRITSQSATVYVLAEPEITAAIEHCKKYGITGECADLAIPAVLEVELARLRAKSNGKMSVEAYPAVREKHVRSMNRARALGKTATKSMDREMITATSENYKGAIVSTAAAAVLSRFGSRQVDALFNGADGKILPFDNAHELRKEAELARKKRIYKEVGHRLGVEGQTFVIGDPESMTALLYTNKKRKSVFEQTEARRSPNNRSVFQGFARNNSIQNENAVDVDDFHAPAISMRPSDIADERSMSVAYRSHNSNQGFAMPVDEDDLPEASEAFSSKYTYTARELESERTLDRQERLMAESELVVCNLQEFEQALDQEENFVDTNDGGGSKNAQVVALADPQPLKEPESAFQEFFRGSARRA